MWVLFLKKRRRFSWPYISIWAPAASMLRSGAAALVYQTRRQPTPRRRGEVWLKWGGGRERRRVCVCVFFFFGGGWFKQFSLWGGFWLCYFGIDAYLTLVACFFWWWNFMMTVIDMIDGPLFLRWDWSQMHPVWGVLLLYAVSWICWSYTGATDFRGAAAEPIACN